MVVDHSHALLTAVADTDVSLQNEVEEKFSTCFFHSVDELLSLDLKIDWSLLQTPNGLHAQQAIKALSKSHHVVIEKPWVYRNQNVKKWLLKPPSFQTGFLRNAKTDIPHPHNGLRVW